MDRARRAWCRPTLRRRLAETCAAAGSPPSASARCSWRRRTAPIADRVRVADPPSRLTLPVQNSNEREQPARGLEIDPHLALQALLQRARSLVMDATAAH